MAFAAPTLRLSVTQHERILGHCYAGLPDEACGLLAGPVTGPLDGREATGAVSEVYPAVNADASARTYTVDGRDYLRATRDAEARGDEIIGVWHSHTHTDPYPSPTDVRSAVDPMWPWIVSLLCPHPDAARLPNSRRCDRRVPGRLGVPLTGVTLGGNVDPPGRSYRLT